MVTQKLSFQNLFLVGFTLFSMFFGAGNLIFPPFLAAQAGTQTWPAMVGFLISAVGLPVLGVAAVALSGGLVTLTGRVGAGFSLFFTLLAYLSIGPCLAIPRTASTSFEMTVLPVLNIMGMRLNASLSLMGITLTVRSWAQIAYSLVFFFIALLLSLKPEKLTERLGKILCPTLLILIAVIFTGCLMWPLGPYAAVGEAYSSGPGVKGFLAGYQTMDTIAALNFGIIIALNIQAKGIQQEGAVVKETIKAGVIAGVLLTLVYGALAHIGAPVGSRAGAGANGARILTYVADSLFGNAGMMILGIIFFIACLNTCVGLISCCSQYFSTLLPRVGYQGWAFIFACISLVISSAGLDLIVKVSLPVLNAIYPVAIVLIFLSFLDKLIEQKRGVYRYAILFTGIVSVVYALEQAGIILPVIEAAVCYLPGYSVGLGWIVPALVGIVLGMLLPFDPVFDKD